MENHRKKSRSEEKGHDPKKEGDLVTRICERKGKANRTTIIVMHHPIASIIMEKSTQDRRKRSFHAERKERFLEATLKPKLGKEKKKARRIYLQSLPIEKKRLQQKELKRVCDHVLKGLNKSGEGLERHHRCG